MVLSACPFFGGLSYFGMSFIGGFTIVSQSIATGQIPYTALGDTYPCHLCISQDSFSVVGPLCCSFLRLLLIDYIYGSLKIARLCWLLCFVNSKNGCAILTVLTLRYTVKVTNLLPQQICYEDQNNYLMHSITQSDNAMSLRVI